MKMVWMPHLTPLGKLILAGTEKGLAGAWFIDQAHFDGLQSDWIEDRQAALLKESAAQIDAWFARKIVSFELALAPIGTPFQQAVWSEISKIGFGETRSYGQVAQAIGKPGASRAVGAATGRNPLSIIIPCHRLLGGNGALTGYAGGLERKRFLLAHESSESFALVD